MTGENRAINILWVNPQNEEIIYKKLEHGESYEQ